jgi:hypothetical protein
MPSPQPKELAMSARQGRSEEIPLPELERYRDADWALHDPGVQAAYDGQWVVAYQRRVIASGIDAAAVIDQARRAVQGQVHHPVYCGRDDPAAGLEDAADSCDA